MARNARHGQGYVMDSVSLAGFPPQTDPLGNLMLPCRPTMRAGPDV